MEHNIGYWVWFLVIGGVVGWVAGLITRGHEYGIIGKISVGIIGAMLGGWMARVIGLSAGSLVGAFLLGLFCAVTLVSLTCFILRNE